MDGDKRMLSATVPVRRAFIVNNVHIDSLHWKSVSFRVSSIMLAEIRTGGYTVFSPITLVLVIVLLSKLFRLCRVGFIVDR